MSYTHEAVPAPAAVRPVPVRGLIQHCGGISRPPGTRDRTDAPADAVHRSADRISAGSGPVPSSVRRMLDTAGTSLDASTRVSMEARPGHDFGHVRVHTDAEAARSAKAIKGARASRPQSPGGLRPSRVPVAPAGQAGLPERLKAGVERLSGRSLGGVRVHYNSRVPAGVGAFACTRGPDIDLGPGQERHLPHEAWHVVQQMQGRVKPAVQAMGLPVNGAERLEREADKMGAKALSIGRALPAAGPVGHVGDAAGTAMDRDGGSSWQDTTDVVQLASTNLRFDANVNGNSQITATQHDRGGGVHTVAANWVFGNGAWKSAPDNTVINHSRPYNDIAQNILVSIHDQTLADAADIVSSIHSDLRDTGKGIGDAPAAYANRLNNVITNPATLVDVDDIIDTFNYYLYKICDYPANLFVWPRKSGRNPDEPVGEYDDTNVPHTDWKVSNTLIGKKRRLSGEKTRLGTARDAIEDAIETAL